MPLETNAIYISQTAIRRTLNRKWDESIPKMG
jgi:hypothetical protein